MSVDNVLDIRAFDLKKTVEMDPEFLNTENEHEHDATVSRSREAPADLEAIQRWFNYLLAEGYGSLSHEGILNVANAEERFCSSRAHDLQRPLTSRGKGETRRACVHRQEPRPRRTQGGL